MKNAGEAFEFKKGFEGLHNKSYEAIVQGNGFGLDKAAKAIQIVHDVRNQKEVGEVDHIHAHPFIKLPLTHHPFS